MSLCLLYSPNLSADLMQFLFSSLCPSPILSSSTISLDKLLDAGLYTGEVTEIVGGPGSGKTQVPMGPTVGEGWGRWVHCPEFLGGGRGTCRCPCGFRGQTRPDEC